MGLAVLHGADTQQEITKKMSRRRRETHDSKTWVSPVEIPLDLLIEILTRLPVTSVMRFKCISKLWSNLFYSRYFCNRFLMMVPSPAQPRLYMSLVDKSEDSKSLLLSSAPATSPSFLVLDQDLTVSDMGGHYLRVLRGFICFTVYLKARIYNPSTRQLVILPPISDSDIIAEEDVFGILFFICHDPVNDQYKLLCTITALSDHDYMGKIRSEQWVFLLEAGCTWKRVAEEFQPHLPLLLELNMNGVLYYSAWTDMDTCVLVSFDARSEEFSMIQVPCKAGDVLDRRKRRVTQIDHGGKVAVLDTTYLKENGTVDLWIVEDWRKKEWSRKTLVLKPSQMHLVIGNRFIPRVYGQNLKGKVILQPKELISPFYFLCCDLEINDLEKVEIKGIPDNWFSKPEKNIYFDIQFMDPSESIIYLET